MSHPWPKTPQPSDEERIEALERENKQLLSELRRREKQVIALRESEQRHEARAKEMRRITGQQSAAIIELASFIAEVAPDIPVSDLVRDIAEHNPTLSLRLAKARAERLESYKQ